MTTNIPNFLPQTFQEKLPEPGEKELVQVNKQIRVKATFTTQKDEFAGSRREVEWIILDDQKIKMEHTIRVFPQMEGAKRYWFFRTYGYDGKYYQLAFDPNKLRWELLFYQF